MCFFRDRAFAFFPALRGKAGQQRKSPGLWDIDSGRNTCGNGAASARCFWMEQGFAGGISGAASFGRCQSAGQCAGEI